MEKKFKAYDRVLIKTDVTAKWQCDLYSHWDSEYEYHVTVGYIPVSDRDILPYEGNEHLVGTTNEQPYEEVKLEKGEHLYVFNDKRDFPNNLSFSRFYYATKGSIKTFNGINAIHACWNFAIRFSDFNPNDMEETKKHILTVKNGKIIRYKE